eukprot:jgi/Mesvir1/9419/Mv01521-RA.1
MARPASGFGRRVVSAVHILSGCLPARSTSWGCIAHGILCAGKSEWIPGATRRGKFHARANNDDAVALASQAVDSFLGQFVNFESRGVPACAGTDTARGFDLAKMYGLLSVIGEPHTKLQAVHIAGSKGKGSTSTFLAHILRRGRYRVGLYTSPHISSITERISILDPPPGNSAVASTIIDPARKTAVARRDIDPVQLAALVGRHRAAIEAFHASNPVSHFEVLTALALRHFVDERVDISVLETGLGGIRDATNVVPPDNLALAVITHLSMEHADVLGGTLESIAAAKAGIIKSGRPVVVATQDSPEALRIVLDAAARAGAPATLVPHEVLCVPLADGLQGGGSLAENEADKGSRGDAHEAWLCEGTREPLVERHSSSGNPREEARGRKSSPGKERENGRESQTEGRKGRMQEHEPSKEGARAGRAPVHWEQLGRAGSLVTFVPAFASATLLEGGNILSRNSPSHAGAGTQWEGAVPVATAARPTQSSHEEPARQPSLSSSPSSPSLSLSTPSSPSTSPSSPSPSSLSAPTSPSSPSPSSLSAPPCDPLLPGPWRLPPTRLPLRGRHQRDNAATAVCAALVLRKEGWGGITQEAITQGLEETVLPGRFQILRHGDLAIVIDGAHTPSAAGVLAETLIETLPASLPVALVVAMATDKDHAGFASAFLRTYSRGGASSGSGTSGGICPGSGSDKSSSSSGSSGGGGGGNVIGGKNGCGSASGSSEASTGLYPALSGKADGKEDVEDKTDTEAAEAPLGAASLSSIVELAAVPVPDVNNDVSGCADTESRGFSIHRPCAVYVTRIPVGGSSLRSTPPALLQEAWRDALETEAKRRGVERIGLSGAALAVGHRPWKGHNAGGPGEDRYSLPGGSVEMDRGHAQAVVACDSIEAAIDQAAHTLHALALSRDAYDYEMCSIGSYTADGSSVI